MIVTVLIADDKPDMSGETFDPKGIRFMKRPEELEFDPHKPLNVVPVYFGNDYKAEHFLGNAVLFMDGEQLKADLQLVHDPKVRLYPSVCGSVIKKTPATQDKRSHIVECVVDKIALTLVRNQDERIPPICPSAMTNE